MDNNGATLFENFRDRELNQQQQDYISLYAATNKGIGPPLHSLLLLENELIPSCDQNDSVSFIG
jgi:hypothetical protein